MIHKFVNVIDVESTCWKTPEDKLRNEISEIIEIGIVVVDTEKLEIIDTESLIIKPQYSRVSSFCTQLTTLTPDQVNGGELFVSRARLLERQRFDGSNRAWVSWGDYDRKMFEEMSKLYEIRNPCRGKHMNLKTMFTVFHGLNNELGLDVALKHLDIKLEGTHHRGVDDAKNIAKIFIHTLKQFRNHEK